ncbi:Bud site selection protein, Revert to axial protein 1 [Tulasnella sp. JGI-2019a]|nr:Bud site selection protein, Revert to axial protein 1 [Tulasnella sp. JGI-2019a]KAG9003851.1 Bud site selection protein, Revert to axial protein 1 [Tulasnella sp. JGI-2019a]
MASTTPADERRMSYREERQRLPTFEEVLYRKTRPPVDLFNFYLFLQREGAEDVLDFWLDVQQHENLCRAYFKDIRKSGKTIKEDWPQYWDYARKRGSIYGTVLGLGAGKRSTASSGEGGERDQEKRAMSSLSHSRADTPMWAGGAGGAAGHEKEATQKEQDANPPRSSTPFSLSIGRRSATMSRRASRAPTFIPRDAAITRTDLIASAERIFVRYLVPSSDKEIYLPPSLRIHEFPLSPNHLPNPTSPEYETESLILAQVPDMFHTQKEYVFRAMEQDAFPRFLRAKAFGNLTPVSALFRLCVGLVALWAGLATAFSLIFLDVKPKTKRFFLFVPFTIACLFLVSHQYELDPILVFLNQSETTPFRTMQIREPYVRKLLLGRAIWVTFLITVLVIALTLIFWAVPGHRL